MIEPFNAKYGTKAETVGGWDQMVAQIVAAPADNPPFDITIADEYTTSAGLAENLFLETDRSKIPGFEAVYPWFDETRGDAKKYRRSIRWRLAVDADGQGVGVAAGQLDEFLASRRCTARRRWMRPPSIGTSAFRRCFPTQSPVSTRFSARRPRWKPLFVELEKLKMAKWYKDGAELSNLMLQDEAAGGHDVFGRCLWLPQGARRGIRRRDPEGRHGLLHQLVHEGARHQAQRSADLFLGYLLEKETQQRFLDVATDFMSRSDLAAPAHWPNYPTSNDDMKTMFNLFSLDGWATFGANWEALDTRHEADHRAHDQG